MPVKTAAVLLGLFLVALCPHTFANEPELPFPNFRPVNMERLRDAVRRANRLVVTKSPRGRGANVVFFTSGKREDIEAFAEAVQIVPPKHPNSWFHCMCDGTPAVRFYLGNQELALVTSHHGRSVRTSLWTSDSILLDSEKWLKWFDDRGMPGPRREVAEGAEESRQSAIEYARWLSAMPPCLRPVWIDDERRQGEQRDNGPLRKALAEAVPDPRERALALFAWYGSGDGAWSGYSGYETVAADLLLDLPLATLMEVAGRDDLSEAQSEGAARLFAGWEFSRRYPEGASLLPVTLRLKLLSRCLVSSYNFDNLNRARLALWPW